jgi:hypothetical protein
MIKFKLNYGEYAWSHTLVGAIALILILLFCVSCDDRNLGKPEIYVTITRDTLYTLDNAAYQESDIYIQLVGNNPTLYANKRIDVIYDPLLAHVVVNATASGHQSYFVTDRNGIVTGWTYARRVGTLNLEFVVRGFKNVRTTKQIEILHPFISRITAEPTTIPADDTTLSEIRVYVTPRISGLTVDFTTDWGDLTALSSETDMNGMARTYIKSAYQGFGLITAKLNNFPENPKRIEVYFDFTEDF